MIIVTGTKRSGTSMWMQILIAAGFEPFGEAFPKVWENTIKDANPDGFYESILRRGIYWATNPHPRTGDYFFPEQVENHVVKVFIPGLVRTDRAFIGHVVATMRPWREYESSLKRLYDMEDSKRAEAGHGTPPPRMPAVLEWWHENFSLVRDIVTRRHRVHVQSYDGLLRDPSKVIHETIAWLGRGDAEAALAAVKPGNRTQKQPESSSIEPQYAEVFDELYKVVDERTPITPAFIAKLNATNVELAPRMAAAQKEIAAENRRRRREGRPGGEPEEDVDAQPSW
ncbi:MAG: hypothetical protein U0168_19620 [Nannocystaceae bacterium]|jgi:hypothetical protein